MPPFLARTDGLDLQVASIPAVLGEVGVRFRAHRLALNRTQAWVAEEAGVSKRTVERLEAGESVQLESWLRVLRAVGLLSHLDVLLPPPQPSPLAQVQLQERTRQRASPQADAPTGPWTWGDEG